MNSIDEGTMAIEAEGQGTRDVLTIEGAMTVQRAVELKAVFVDALAKMDRVAVDLSRVMEVDLCGLQLLCSAQRTASQSRKRLAIVGPAPDVLRRAVDEAGGCVRTGCGVDDTGRCPWKGGMA